MKREEQASLQNLCTDGTPAAKRDVVTDYWYKTWIIIAAESTSKSVKQSIFSVVSKLHCCCHSSFIVCFPRLLSNYMWLDDYQELYVDEQKQV